MDNTQKAQIIDKLKSAQNVLITVSANPSVDQLSAAIGFTLMMNKLGKHATAVYSGTTPSTVEFLRPEETLEQNTDSLRDFIIALDKSKADKLRYKVEENVVKIFITPYRTSLSEADLQFSQGDFNVDAVIALGVDEQEHIDQAIKSHGLILHDATVIGVMAGDAPIDVGSINWQDPSASSLCEMLVSISESFKSGILDTQMATAFLTGIVAETERFRNEKTSPKVMTMAAQLMAAGANQQLIASNLDLPPETPPQQPSQPDQNGGGDQSNQPVDLPPVEPVAAVEQESGAAEGTIDIHGGEKKAEPKSSEIHIDEHGTYKTAADLAVDAEIAKKSAEQIAQSGLNSDTEAKESVDNQVSPYSKFVSEPPRTGGVLTANANPEPLEPSTDPLSSIASSGHEPLFGKTQKLEPLDSTTNPSPGISENVPDIVPDTLPSIDDTPSIPITPPQPEPPLPTEPPANDKTENTGIANFAANAEAARKAVMEAVNSIDNYPQPPQALQTPPPTEPTNLTFSPPEVETNAPPIVPPPIVPPPSGAIDDNFPQIQGLELNPDNTQSSVPPLPPQDTPNPPMPNIT